MSSGLSSLRLRSSFCRPRCNSIAYLRSQRGFSNSETRPEQHLLWAGTLLDKSASRFETLDQDLFLASGAAEDISLADITLLGPCASPSRGHSLLPYRTNDASKLTRILAVGRNTSGQLGVGFASQEATFGLIRPGFEGTRGVIGCHAGPEQTWILTGDDEPGGLRLFGCGNDTVGQIAARSGPRSSSGIPRSSVVPSPREVKLESIGTTSKTLQDGELRSIDHFANGLSHSLLSTTQVSGDTSVASVLSTGLHADGQLGRELTERASDQSPPWSDATWDLVLSHSQSVQKSRPSRTFSWRVAAGGDTSFAWLVGTDPQDMKIYAWGNNEYAQCLAPVEGTGDLIDRPLDITAAVAEILPPLAAIIDIHVGSSWTAVLDSEGNVYTAGVGAVGRLQEGRPCRLAKIEGLPSIRAISGSLDAVMAVSSCGRKVYVWGLETDSKSLGNSVDDDDRQPGQQLSLDAVHRLHRPREIQIKKWLGQDGLIEHVACGIDQSWILVEDGQEPKGVWRGSQAQAVSLRASGS